MVILSTKLRNAIVRYNPKGNYEFKLLNINRNYNKRGCSGFITNKDNGLIIYVNTERCVGYYDRMMFRYAKSTKDYVGSINRWVNNLPELVSEICGCLEQNREVRL